MEEILAKYDKLRSETGMASKEAAAQLGVDVGYIYTTRMNLKRKADTKKKVDLFKVRKRAQVEHVEIPVVQTSAPTEPKMICVVGTRNQVIAFVRDLT